MKRVLIVEDEKNIREFEVINLRRLGYDTVEAGTAEDALALFDLEPETFDIALLDISMPGMDGFELCRLLRERTKMLGIIMLTARTLEEDKINGLGLGADDYVTKPFSPSELAARIESLYRRVEMLREKSMAPSPEEIKLGKFILNTRKHTLSKEGKLIELTQVEYLITELFFQNPDKQIRRGEILEYVWGENYVGEEKIVDVNIRRLRMKIEDDPGSPCNLMTVWGMGYKWNSAEN